MKTYTRVYQSVAEMIEACDATWQTGRRKWNDEQIEDRAGFIGRHYTSWAEVVADANSDWPVGQRIVAEMLAQMQGVDLPEPVSVRRRACWSEDGGDELDNDRLRSGQEYWRTTRRQSTRTPRTVCIIANVTTPAYVEPDDVIWRGAAAVVLANLLEAAGYRVELWAAQHCRPAYVNGAGMFQATCLKRADQPLDVATVINGVSGWFYRLMFFQSYFNELRSEPRPSLGTPCPLVQAKSQLDELVGNADRVVIDGVFDRAAAIDLIKTTINKLGQ